MNDVISVPIQPYYSNAWGYWSTHYRDPVQHGEIVSRNEMKLFLQWIYDTNNVSINDNNVGYFTHFVFQTEHDKTMFMLKWG